MSEPPQFLRDQTRWLLWKSDDGRKVPCSRSGHAIDSTNPNNWMPYEDAYAAYADDPQQFAGRGFALGNGVCGIDLDDVIVNGEVLPWAKEIVDACDSYSEISPSKTGLKIFCTTETVSKAYKRKNEAGGAIEVYFDKRWFAFTGCGETKPLRPIPQALILPPEVDEAIGDKPPGYDRCLERIMLMPESISGNHGHDAIFAVACEIIRHGILGQAGYEILSAFNKERAQPAWDGKDLKRKYREAIKRCTADGEVGSYSEARSLSEFSTIEPTAEKPEPAAWTVNLPAEAFDNPLGRYAQADDPFSEADANIVFIRMLSMFGNVIGRLAYVQIGREKNYAKIFLVVVGLSFKGRKGTSYVNAIAPFQAAFSDWVKHRITKFSSGEGVISFLRDPDEAEVEPSEDGEESDPILNMVDCERRCLWRVGEFQEILTYAGREGSTTNIVILDAFDDVPLARNIVDRKDSFTASKTHVSIQGDITPDGIRNNFRPSYFYSGFGNRFLYLYSIRRKQIEEDELEPDEQSVIDEQRALIASRCASEMKEALDWLTDLQSDNDQCGLQFSFGASCRDEFRKFKATFEVEVVQQESKTADLLSRGLVIIKRAALVLAILDKSQTIEAKHLRTAIEVFWYGKKSADYIFADVSGSEAEQEEKELIAWITKKGGRITVRGLTTSNRSYRDAGMAEAALTALVKKKIGQWEVVSTATAQRREFVLNEAYR